MKTVSAAILSARHPGGLVHRHVSTGGVLPGTTVMVTETSHCVLVAGERVTAVLEMGPTLLELSHFNMQPAAIAYTVPVAPETVSWYPSTSAYGRTLTVQVTDPKLFIEQMVIDRGLEKTEEVVAALAETLDGMVAPGTLDQASTATQASVGAFLLRQGLSLVHFGEKVTTAPPPTPPR